MNSRQLLTGSYLALLGLQLVWHALLPRPLGTGSWLLAALAAGVTALVLPAALRRSEPAKKSSLGRSRSGDVQY